MKYFILILIYTPFFFWFYKCYNLFKYVEICQKMKFEYFHCEDAIKNIINNSKKKKAFVILKFCWGFEKLQEVIQIWRLSMNCESSVERC